MFPSITDKCSQSLNTQPDVLLPWAKPTASARCSCPLWVKSCLLQLLKHVRAPGTRGLISVICTISSDMVWCTSVPAGWTSINQCPASFLSDFVFLSEAQVSASNSLVMFKNDTSPAQIKCSILWLKHHWTQNPSAVWCNGNQEKQRISTQGESRLHDNEETWGAIPFQSLVSDAYSWKRRIGLGFDQVTALCSTVVRMAGGGFA